MTYKTILVHLTSQKVAPALLDVVLPFAASQGAHVTGLHVIPNVPLHQSVAFHVPDDVITQQQQQLLDEAAAIHKLFEERAGAAGVTSEWRRVESDNFDLTRDVSAHALSADLVALRQGTTDPFDAFANLPTEVALHCGRPVLTVPNYGTFPTLGKKVMVAWNGSREAARAAFDALPFAAGGGHIDIISINATDKNGTPRFTLPDELGHALRRHGVEVDCLTAESGEISVGDEILNRVSDFGYDMVAMGCYGHSRLRETIFGGATHDMFNHMTVPVLMSH